MTTTLAPNPQIASDAMAYQGHAYIYGGSPGTDGKSGWDCSSFCNWVIGHDLGGAIPGFAAGSYNGTSHGPPTGSWLITSLCKGISKSDLQPGDLIVWQTHMGIYVGNGNMISALNPQLGTLVTSISGGSPGGEIPFYKRYNSALSSSSATLTSWFPSINQIIGGLFDPGNPTGGALQGGSGIISSGLGEIGTVIGSGLGAAAGGVLSAGEKGLLKVFGVSTIKDLLIRAALLILAVVLIVEGIRTGFGGSGIRQTTSTPEIDKEIAEESTAEPDNQIDTEMEGVEA